MACLDTECLIPISRFCVAESLCPHTKHVSNDGAAATAQAAQLDTKKLCPSPCPHHHSAPSRPHPLICTGVEPIHPVHCPRQLPAWPCRPMAPRNEVIFLPFWRGFIRVSCGYGARRCWCLGRVVTSVGMAGTASKCDEKKTRFS